MGYLRFNRRRQIIPGVRLNLSKSGPSLSFGTRGLHYTVGHGRRRTTVGLPGTGLSYTTAHSTRTRRRPAAARPMPVNGRPHPQAQQSLTNTVQGSPGCGLVLGLLFLVAGIALTVALPGFGIGVLLVAAWILAVAAITMRRPTYRAHRLLRAADRQPEHAEEFLTGGLALLPHNPLLLAGLGDLWFHADRYDDAAGAYQELLRLQPDTPLVKARLADCMLHLSAWEAAIPLLRELSSATALTDESRYSMVAHLALALLATGEGPQAVEQLRSVPLRRQTLGSGLQECLFMRAAAHYFSGQRSVALHDLERLYTIAPDYAGLAEAKMEMAAGRFTFTLHGVVVAPRPALAPPVPVIRAPVVPAAASGRVVAAARPPLVGRLGRAAS